MGIINVNLPATDAWKELMKRRTSHRLKDFMGTGKDIDIEDVKILYKLSEDGERATLYDIYKDGMKLEGDGIVVPLSSTFEKVLEIKAGTKFVNVVGSTGDKLDNVNSNCTWIQIYEQITQTENNRCCTNGMEYTVTGNQCFWDEVRHCNFDSTNEEEIRKKTIGGHVIVGYTDNNNNEYIGAKQNHADIPKKNDTVGILPICSAHNNYHRDKNCMITGIAVKAVIIKYLVDRTVFKNYIN